MQEMLADARWTIRREFSGGAKRSATVWLIVVFIVVAAVSCMDQRGAV